MPTTDEEIMRQLMATFKLEADEHLQAMNDLLLKLEKNKDADTAKTMIEDIFREAHSLKGAARAVNAGLIESIAHGVENVFAAAKRQEIGTPPALFDLLYESLDHISGGLKRLDEGCRPTSDTERLLKRLNEAGDSSKSNSEPIVDKKPEAHQPKIIPTAKNMGKTSSNPISEETIRVSTRKLDALMTHVEELLSSKIRTEQRLAELKEIKGSIGDWQKNWHKTRSVYDRLRRHADEDTEEILTFLGDNQRNLKSTWQETNRLLQDFSKDTTRMSLITEDLQEDIRRVRMLPVAAIFNAYSRMVRDMAREQGKQIELVVSGTRTELDKKVIEGIKDPLMHMLRNSIDHGIEKPEVRTALGKPATGTIWLSASQQGNGILIEVEDDGRGIDVERVKNIALAKGLLNSQEAKTISDEEVRYLVFQSGFSTSSVVSNVSGRGVGLDVVKTNIERLNGLVHISPRENSGTKLSINLPLTLSTSRVLLVNCGAETFAIPTSTVERIIRVNKKDVFTVGTKETIDVGGRSLSLARLGDLLELQNKPTNEYDDTLSVIILGAVDRRMAFVVDSLEGETEIVIKSLGKMMSRVRNVAGATILGTGKVVIILNVADLIKTSKTYGRRDSIAPLPESVPDRPSEINILVVDDSITTRVLEKNILELAGYNVLLANDGIEALEALRVNHCHLIISDIDMPHMNGFDLTYKIKHDERLRDLPVILVTALDSTEDRERGLEVGADCYMVKQGFDQKNLLDTIEQLI